MTVSEIFAKLNAHMIKGIMFHDQMTEYYDFLGLHGYKRCHEYHTICEAKARRKLVKYYLNHYNRLIPEEEVKNPHAIPNGWIDYSRQEIDSNTKKRAIRDGFVKWHEWERETKKLYESAYMDLYTHGEVAAAEKMREYIKDADKEIKKIDRIMTELDAIDYNLSGVYAMQSKLHDCYKQKIEKD